MIRSSLAAAVALLLGSGGAALASAPAAATSVAADTVSTLQVSGSAEIDVATDRARVTFAVETEDSIARGASQRNAERMEAVLAALRELDDGLQIETFGYRLQPRYRRTDDRGSREIDGFRATNMIRVTSSEAPAVGRLIDTAVEAGANRVASLSFEASNVEEARLEALREAVASARRQAEAIAGAMGVPLGAALEVQSGFDMPRPMIQYRAEAAALQDASTPVEPGEQTVSANVTIRYRLETP